MSIDERLELFVGDEETLGVAQRRRTCVLAVNQQALEHLCAAAVKSKFHYAS